MARRRGYLKRLSDHDLLIYKEAVLQTYTNILVEIGIRRGYHQDRATELAGVQAEQLELKHTLGPVEAPEEMSTT